MLTTFNASMRLSPITMLVVLMYFFILNSLKVKKIEAEKNKRPNKVWAYDFQ